MSTQSPHAARALRARRSSASARARRRRLPIAVVVLGAASLSLVACASQEDTGRAASGAAAHAGSPQPVISCDPVGNARPICGFQNPEDLVALPGDEVILVSEYGAMEGGKSGALATLTLADESRRVIFRGGDARGAEAAEWGAANCPGPPSPAFSPHGIHLSRRSDGALQLLVVQHGGRESIEFFEVVGGERDFDVRWRGCVVAPADAWLNSVAALPGGGFVTTHMMSRSLGQEDLAASFASGEPTGHVLEWLPEAGFRVVPHTQSVMPNGIEVSPDGERLFINHSGENQVRRVVRDTGVIEAFAALPALDNARWAPDGRLVVASMMAKDPEGFAVCAALETGSCPMAFQIVAVDPDSMKTEVLYQGEGAPMGAGTVGLRIADELFIGSFAGDRVLRVRLE